MTDIIEERHKPNDRINYRVVRTVVNGTHVSYGIHEVTTDAGGNTIRISDKEFYPIGGSLDELTIDIVAMQRALEKPILQVNKTIDVPTKRKRTVK